MEKILGEIDWLQDISLRASVQNERSRNVSWGKEDSVHFLEAFFNSLALGG